MIATRFALFCILAVLPAAGAAAPIPTPEAREALGDRTVAILRGATRVETFRLLSGSIREELEAQHQNLPDVGAVAERIVARRGPIEGKAFATQMNRALFDDVLYDPGGLAKCFDPGVALRFWKGRESVEVALCFECGQLQIVTLGADGKQFHEIPQLAMGFDQPLLVRLLREVFPHDTDMMAVKPYGLTTDLAAPEPRAAIEDDVREAVFHFLMARRPSAQTPAPVYAFSVGVSDRASVRPSPTLLRRLPAPIPGRGPSMWLRVAHLRWIEPAMVYADASVAMPTGKPTAYTERVEKRNGHWAVTEETRGE